MFTFFKEDVFLVVFKCLLEASFCWLALPLFGGGVFFISTSNQQDALTAGFKDFVTPL
jgi:hypothetical protein